MNTRHNVHLEVSWATQISKYAKLNNHMMQNYRINCVIGINHNYKVTLKFKSLVPQIITESYSTYNRFDIEITLIRIMAVGRDVIRIDRIGLEEINRKNLKLQISALKEACK